MLRVSLLARCLMAFLCLVPFASARQTGLALAPCAPLVPLSPANQAPAPGSEEDDERETAELRERLAAQVRHRQPLPHRIDLLPLARDFRAATHPHSPTSPFDADPFRNGLGSPYRC